MQQRYEGRNLFGGYCIIVNECHGLRADTVKTLLTALDPLPEYVVWVFTTTKQGQATFFEDNAAGDAAPLVSRCVEIILRDGPEVNEALAARAKFVAQAAGIDGLPDSVYLAAIRACKGNLRAVLQRVESGQLERTAQDRFANEQALAALKSTKGEWAEQRRAELTALLA